MNEWPYTPSHLLPSYYHLAKPWRGNVNKSMHVPTNSLAQAGAASVYHVCPCQWACLVTSPGERYRWQMLCLGDTDHSACWMLLNTAASYAQSTVTSQRHSCCQCRTLCVNTNRNHVLTGLCIREDMGVVLLLHRPRICIWFVSISDTGVGISLIT